MSWQRFPLRYKRCCCSVLILALAACQTAGNGRAPRMAFDAEPNLGTVAFVALPLEPQLDLKGFASGKGSGALGAAGATFTSCFGAGGSLGNCSGGGSLGAAVCGAAVLVWLGVCTVATGASAIGGAALADSATSVQANVKTISANLDAA